jgi:hypothetical protein
VLIANDFNLVISQSALEYLKLRIKDVLNTGDQDRGRLQVTWPSRESDVSHTEQLNVELPKFWLHTLCEISNLDFERQIVSVQRVGANRTIVEDGKDVSNVLQAFNAHGHNVSAVQPEAAGDQSQPALGWAVA